MGGNSARSPSALRIFLRGGLGIVASYFSIFPPIFTSSPDIFPHQGVIKGLKKEIYLNDFQGKVGLLKGQVNGRGL
jgi:hypothetical protein